MTGPAEAQASHCTSIAPEYPQPQLAIESRVDGGLRSGGCVDLASAERCRVKASHCEQMATDGIATVREMLSRTGAVIGPDCRQ